jgi:hypothetical protein
MAIFVLNDVMVTLVTIASFELPWLPVLPTSGLRGFYGNTDEAELFRCA